MKKLLFLLLCTLFLLSCDTLKVNCDECYSEEPELGTLSVSLGGAGNTAPVELIFYRGKVEDNQIEYQDTVYENYYELPETPLNQYYSVKAIYTIAGKTYIAIDGGDFDTKLITDNCEYDCYIIKGGNYDVRLND